MEFMRVWTEVDVEDVQKHIIMVEDKFGHCPGCKQIGIELKDVKKCPGCGREFRYMTSKDARGGKTDVVMRSMRKLSGLVFVDYDDYERVTGKKKAESLFNI